MIIPDINLLIYARNKQAPDHQEAKAWWEGLLNGRDPVGLPWMAAMAVEHQAELHSADTDFHRFPGLRWKNPLAACSTYTTQKPG